MFSFHITHLAIIFYFKVKRDVVGGKREARYQANSECSVFRSRR